MTKSRSRKSGKGFAGSHQRSWLWGRHAVHETLLAGRWPIMELLIDDELPAETVNELTSLAKKNDVVVQYASPNRILELCHADDHQGVLARLGEFPSLDHATLMKDAARAVEKTTQAEPNLGLKPLFVICDRIQDAHNFGAILRCCDAMNVSGVVIGERSQATISPHVARSSAGAVNHVRIYRVSDLVEVLKGLSQCGFRIAAATEKSSEALAAYDLKVPTAVVIGSEAVGVAKELLQHCPMHLTIPMLGRMTSLNAAVAAGIILYEIRRQQRIAGE